MHPSDPKPAEPRTRPVNVVMKLTPLDWETIEELRRLMPGGTSTTAGVVRHALREFHRHVTTGAAPALPPPDAGRKA